MKKRPFSQRSQPFHRWHCQMSIRITSLHSLKSIQIFFFSRQIKIDFPLKYSISLSTGFTGVTKSPVFIKGSCCRRLILLLVTRLFLKKLFRALSKFDDWKVLLFFGFEALFLIIVFFSAFIKKRRAKAHYCYFTHWPLRLRIRPNWT